MNPEKLNLEGQEEPGAEQTSANFERLKAETLSNFEGSVRPLIEKWVNLEYATKGGQG